MAVWLLPRGGDGSGGCAHGGTMSSRPSAWPCPQPSTTVSTRWRLARSTMPYGERRRTGRGRGRSLLRRCPFRRRQSRSVTWLPRGLSSPHRCWRTLLSETVDARTVMFLLQKTFARKKEEEEEEEEERRKEVAKQQEEKYEAKMLLLNDRVSHDLPLAEDEWAAWREWSVLVPSSSSSGKRRKRKKRRKRRLPRGARIRRCGQGFRSRSSLTGAQCSLWSSTGLRCPASWPECTRWTAPRSSSSMAVACARVVLVATADLVLCSLLLVTGPRCLTSWPVRIRRTVTFTLVACLDGLLVTLHLALCFFPCRQAQSPERVDSSYF